MTSYSLLYVTRRPHSSLLSRSQMSKKKEAVCCRVTQHPYAPAHRAHKNRFSRIQRLTPIACPLMVSHALSLPDQNKADDLDFATYYLF